MRTSIRRPVHERLSPNRCTAPGTRLAFAPVDRQSAVEVAAGAIDVDIEGIEGRAAVGLAPCA